MKVYKLKQLQKLFAKSNKMFGAANGLLKEVSINLKYFMEREINYLCESIGSETLLRLRRSNVQKYRRLPATFQDDENRTWSTWYVN